MAYPPSSGNRTDPTRPLSGLLNDNQENANPGQQSTPAALAVSQLGPGQPAGGVPHPPSGPYPGAYPVNGPYPNAFPMNGYPQPTYLGYGYRQPETNGLSVAALVLSLVGIVSCVTAPAGAALGHVAQQQIRGTGERGNGLAKAAIIIGWIMTGLTLLSIASYVVLFGVSAAILIGSTP